MLVIGSASARQVGYWQRSAVHWSWEGGAVGPLGLHDGPGTPAGRRDLAALLTGCRPSTGLPLTGRPGLRKRQGWDLVFAAPKSVSLLVAGGADAPGRLLGAYRQAVSGALGLLEAEAAVVRVRGADVPARFVVAAFEHRTNADGHPHLHTHAVLVNLGLQPDDRWGCLAGNHLWRWREAAGAAFQLALRSGVRSAGLALAWEVLPGGLAELAGVAGPARAALSGRSLAVRAAATRSGTPGAGALRTAQAGTRGAASGPGRPAPVVDGGATLLAVAARLPCLPGPPPAEGAVVARLADRSSAFGRPDVWAALAETCPDGLDLGEAARWVDAAALAWQRPGGGGAAPLSTPLAGRYDTELVELATRGQFAHLAEVSPEIAELELGYLGCSGPAWSAALQLACSGHAISVVAPGPWLAQAACIDAARAVWQAAGAEVTVATPSALALRRWQALTGLGTRQGPLLAPGPGRPGTAAGSRVLVVDAADRVGPAGLARLARAAGRSSTKLVLVLGGTAAGRGRPCSLGLEELAERSATGPGPHQWPGSTGGHPVHEVEGLAVRGAATGWQAMAYAAQAGVGHGADGTGRALVVAYGADEAAALNEMAARDLPGPGLALGDRVYRPGSPVLALRRVGPVPAATRGRVVELGSSWLAVRWELPSGAVLHRLGPGEADRLGHGHATTVPYLRHLGPSEPLVVLGAPEHLGARSAQVTSAVVTVAGPGAPALGPAGWHARDRAAARQLAVGWPDESMLQRAGPRPLGAAARRRWAATVAECAFERMAGAHAPRSGPALPHPGREPGPAQATSRHGAMMPW